jgi:hypothetical protein
MLPPCSTRLANPVAIDFLQDRDQVLRTQENEFVGLRRVEIARQSLVGLAGNCGQRNAPSQSERPVARARIVRQGKLRSKPERPGLVAMGTAIEPVPVTGLAANFSPIPRIAPPPLGSEMDGG